MSRAIGRSLKAKRESKRGEWLFAPLPFLSREGWNPNRLSAPCYSQCGRKSLENTKGYSLRDFLCLEKSKGLKTAKHLSARYF